VQVIAAVVNDLAARGVVFQRYDGMDQDPFGIWVSPAAARVVRSRIRTQTYCRSPDSPETQMPI
jgi:hypothetical protein